MKVGIFLIKCNYLAWDYLCDSNWLCRKNQPKREGEGHSRNSKLWNYSEVYVECSKCVSIGNLIHRIFTPRPYWKYMKWNSRESLNMVWNTTEKNQTLISCHDYCLWWINACNLTFSVSKIYQTEQKCVKLEFYFVCCRW